MFSVKTAPGFISCSRDWKECCEQSHQREFLLHAQHAGIVCGEVVPECHSLLVTGGHGAGN